MSWSLTVMVREGGCEGSLVSLSLIEGITGEGVSLVSLSLIEGIRVKGCLW